MVLAAASLNSTEHQPESRLQALEQLIRNGDVSVAQIQTYCDLALSAGCLARARATIEPLVQSHRNLFQVHGLYISLCLQLGDDAAAMTAIEGLAGRSEPAEGGLIDAGLTVRKRLGPMTASLDTPHTISLCMIVRNESRLLGPCLNGIKPLVDEIIIVDTGSSDRTSDIGLLFGARVYDFQWCNDFAAARNFCLSKASGQWVLILDADEAIAPRDFETIHRLVAGASEQQAAYAIETRNYSHVANIYGCRSNAGEYPAHETGLGWFPSTKVRLFRRSPVIRFSFPVHERVEPSVKAAGLSVVQCTVPVHHYGHLNEVRNQEKARQYFQLGYAKLEEMSGDSGATRELAVQAGQLERWQEAIVLWERLLDMHPGFVEAYINLSSAHWQLGDYEQSLKWTRKALKENMGLKEARYNEALCFLMLGDPAQAVTVLERVVNEHSNYWSAVFMLAVCYACADQRTEAVNVVRQLQTTAAKDALSGALVDIGQRLQKAGLTECMQRLDTILSQVIGQGEPVMIDSTANDRK